MKNKRLKLLAYIAIAVMGGYLWHQWETKQKLDAYYLEQLQVVKSRMIYGSSVDSPKELDQYQNHIEVCMHLDGYNGPQIMKLRCEAFKNAAIRGEK